MFSVLFCRIVYVCVLIRCMTICVFVCLAACVRVCRYMFDEPSSYLDIRQRLRAAQAIRSMLADNSYVIVVEHDLSVLDYLSDFICVLYGTPSIYGVITMPYSVGGSPVFSF